MNKVAWEERIKSAKDAALRTSMVSVLSQYGVGTKRIGTQVSLTCPWCGAATGECFIYKKNGSERVKCFRCDHNEDVVGVAMVLGGMEYIEALEELTGGEFSLIGRNTDKPAPAKRPAAVVEQREPEPPEVERADADVLDAFYRAMVKATGLTTEHKNHLTKQRGLKKYRLDEYCSWPPVSVADVMRMVERIASKELAARVTEQLERIPGLRRDDTPGFGLPGDGWAFCCTGCPGIALLSVDDLGRARGVQIRADEAIEGRCRYYWLSGGGEDRPSSGTPAGWIPVANNQLAEERHEYLGYRRPKYRPVAAVITEGKFKAEILAQWGYNAVYVSGVGVWRSAGVLDMVRRIAPEGAMVGIAYDADAAEKEQVAKQRTALADALLEAGFRPIIWTWPPEAGKGIDDLVRDGKTESAHKVLLEPYRETEWCRPAEKIVYERASDIPLGKTTVVEVTDCRWRNGYSGRSIIECRTPGATKGDGVTLQRLPMYRAGMVLAVRTREEDGDTYAAWAPAPQDAIWRFYGAPETESPRGKEGSARTPERVAWEAAQHAEEVTARLRLACEIDCLYRDVDKDGTIKGLPCDKVNLAIDKWGADAAEKLRSAPYEYGRTLGISLQACDRIAGIHKGDPAWLSKDRLMWCAEWAMDYATDSGHTRIPVADVIRRIRKYCGIKDGEPFNLDLASILAPGHVIDTDPDGTPVIIHRYYAKCERNLAQTIKARHEQGAAPAAWGAMGEMSAALSEDQCEAVQTLLRTPGITVLTGGPGTGKTYVLSEALRRYRETHPAGVIALCAPTGRAAQQLSETSGMGAKTMHSLLGIVPNSPLDLIEPLDADLVVVDETSMADIELMHSLLGATRIAAQIWMCGDADQLEPVGPGAFLHDTLAAGAEWVGVARLTTIHRQAAGSTIITAGRAVLEGRVPVDGQADGQGCTVKACGTSAEVLAEAEAWMRDNYDPTQPFDSQVLCVCNKQYDQHGTKCPGGTWEMNAILQAIANSHKTTDPEIKYGRWKFWAHDKVLLTRNRVVNGRPVYSNGDLGVITRIDGRKVTVALKTGAEVTLGPDDMQDLELAYATTVHKAQSGTIKKVFIILTEEQVRLMPGLTRNLLYTAITRASEWCKIATSGDGLNLAATAPAHTRRTGMQAEFYRLSAKRKQDEEDMEPFFAANREKATGSDFGLYVDAVEDDDLGAELKARGWT